MIESSIHVGIIDLPPPQPNQLIDVEPLPLVKSQSPKKVKCATCTREYLNTKSCRSRHRKRYGCIIEKLRRGKVAIKEQTRCNECGRDYAKTSSGRLYHRQIYNCSIPFLRLGHKKIQESPFLENKPQESEKRQSQLQL